MKKNCFNTNPSSKGGWIVPTEEDINHIVSQLLDWRGLTYREIALHCGVEYQTTYRALHKPYKMKYPIFFRLCFVAGIEIENNFSIDWNQENEV